VRRARQTGRRGAASLIGDRISGPEPNNSCTRWQARTTYPGLGGRLVRLRLVPKLRLGTLPPEALLPRACTEAGERRARSGASGAKAPKQSLGARAMWELLLVPKLPLGYALPEALLPIAGPRAAGRRTRSRASRPGHPSRSLGASVKLCFPRTQAPAWVRSLGSSASHGRPESYWQPHSKQSFTNRGTEPGAWAPGPTLSWKLRFLRPVPKLADGGVEAELPGRRPSRAGAPELSPRTQAPAWVRSSGSSASHGRPKSYRQAHSKQSFRSRGAQAELGCQGYLLVPKLLLGYALPEALLPMAGPGATGSRTRSRASRTGAPKPELGRQGHLAWVNTGDTQPCPAAAIASSESMPRIS